ncbi:hypothetical protein ABEB36_004386 [Hypothenemus hampei]|uniref:SOCS box domain-containing protein n=1 Tax=Hypothenemus hampei TaxID=57062 RepID=A0ABD1F697_HYPHA
MEQFLECYLDGFEEAPRNTLYNRRNRKQMVEYINTLIQGCAGVDNDNTETTCKEAISTLIRYHNKAKTANGTVCMMGKYHNILYVAMKLCYLWQMQDAELVCQLLREIYLCEQTFERIVIGAIFGTKAPYYLAGWKSDFDNQEENVRGMVYFLDKANRGKMTIPYQHGSLKFRFIDLPIESCGQASPVKLCVQLGLPDRLLILLRFGALILDCIEQMTNIQIIMKRLLEFNHCYPYNLVACLQLLLRIVPEINFRSIENPTEDDHKIDPLIKRNLFEEYEDLIEDGLLPAARCGKSPAELKHLCRCVIRRRLWENFCLPHGIRMLSLPEELWRYLDILDD